MTWDYRIIWRECLNSKAYEIYEVYYDREGKVSSWTYEGASATGNTLEELKESFELYKQAFSRPVLDYDTGMEVSNDNF